eukprot:2795957-Rhodomonas_salina.1
MSEYAVVRKLGEGSFGEAILVRRQQVRFPRATHSHCDVLHWYWVSCCAFGPRFAVCGAEIGCAGLQAGCVQEDACAWHLRERQ